MLKQPELTVIMPAYNVERYLERALAHLAAQSDPNFVLLLVNDGSTDRTEEIARSYQDQFLHLEIINKPNGGLSDARNVGLAHVKTPYFTFHDGDDWVEPDYTASFVTAFHEHPEAAMVSCGFFIDEENGTSRPASPSKPLDQLLTKWQTYRMITNPLGSLFFNHHCVSPVKGYTWNKGYKISVVRQNKMEFVEDLAFMEDQIFNVEYVAQTDGFYASSRPLYHYWQRQDSMVHDFNLKMIPDNFKANYLVWEIIARSLYHERNKRRQGRRKLASVLADRTQDNDRKN